MDGALVQGVPGRRRCAQAQPATDRALPGDGGGGVSVPACRSCGDTLRVTFCDLGLSPVANAFLRAEDLAVQEKFYPLHARVCERCLLVQLEQFEPPERIFSDDYAYFSSYSDSWLKHASDYVDMAVRRFG